ncbi:CHASE3 domain-containing protein [Pseudomonas subflava]|uniref:CHASE3 domain-containing protein n=1 Tax=Pseudomonas subflava TaxID=2952933 RepID=UPI002079C690|nr:CHASE3 domain-containing protein [Pseudomonas subflava]
MRLSIGAKLWGSFCAILLVIVVIGGISYRNTLNMQETARWVAHTHEVLAQLSRLLASVQDAETGQRGYLITGADRYLAPYTAARERIAQEMQALRQLVDDNPDQQRRLDRLEPLLTQRVQALASTIELHRTQGFEVARRQVLTDQGMEVMREIRALVSEMSDEERRLQAIRDTAAAVSANGAQQAILIGLGLSVLIVVVAALFLTQHIGRPLRAVSEVADKVSAGNLAVELAARPRSDEIGLLQGSIERMLRSLRQTAESARQIAAGNLAIEVQPQSQDDQFGQAFAAMIQALRHVAESARQIAAGNLAVDVQPQSPGDQFGQAFSRMLQSLRQMAESARQIAAGNLTIEVQPQSSGDLLGNAFAQMLVDLRQINGDIRSGIEVLTDSASEIAAGSYQIAAGTAETATAISETSTTVEEIKQTAMLSSQRALSVSQTAQRSIQVSQDGRRAVDEVSEGMRRIHQQMELVGENITRLAEQVQTIGEIIATVNDLAEQSNLLAVNASIEAAKAGEQGKGFSVVAQEVKSLAEQSKQATVQVRGILGEIQRATSSTVLAAEQGSRAVSEGVKQSGQAGEAIRLLSLSIDEGAQAVAEIAVSAQQQLAGMDQLVQAMESIREASAQNMSSSKQAEAAAQGLQRLGQKMKDMLARFQI